MRKIIGFIILSTASSFANSYAYVSQINDIGWSYPYAVCLSKTFQGWDAAVTSFSVRCAASGPYFYYSSSTLTIDNDPYATQIYGFHGLTPNVTGKHTMAGVHKFWTFGIDGGNKTSSDSLYWIRR